MGSNICGEGNVIACPCEIAFGTIVEIKGKAYVCEDRMAARFNSRFDINCDTNRTCPFKGRRLDHSQVFDAD